MNKAHFTSRLLQIVMGLLVLSCPVLAQVEGPDGHYYQVVIDPGLKWAEASVKANEATFNGVHGHLATISSAEEDSFIEGLREEAAPGGYGSLWVGGSQLADAAS